MAGYRHDHGRMASVAALALALIIALSGAALACGCAAMGEEGVIQGSVAIGPLCPVEPCTLTGEQIEAAYAARSVIVMAADGKTVIRTLSVDPITGYRTTLPPGTYVIDIAPAGIDRSDDVPCRVILAAGETRTVDIAIDTGIR